MTLYCTTLLEQIAISLKCLWLSPFWLVKNARQSVFTERHKKNISQGQERSVHLRYHKSERTNMRMVAELLGIEEER